MADEQSRAPFNKPSPMPKDFDWQSLLRRDGDELETHYPHLLESLENRNERSALSVNLANGSEESKMPKRGKNGENGSACETGIFLGRS